MVKFYRVAMFLLLGFLFSMSVVSTSAMESKKLLKAQKEALMGRTSFQVSFYAGTSCNGSCKLSRLTIEGRNQHDAYTFYDSGPFSSSGGRALPNWWWKPATGIKLKFYIVGSGNGWKSCTVTNRPGYFENRSWLIITYNGGTTCSFAYSNDR